MPPNIGKSEDKAEASYVPQQFVEQNPPTDPTPSAGLTAIAIYEYDRQDDDEIGLFFILLFES